MDGNNGLQLFLPKLLVFSQPVKKRGGGEECQLILLCFINRINFWFLENNLISLAESCKYLPKIFVDGNCSIWAFIRQVKNVKGWNHPVFLKIRKNSCCDFDCKVVHLSFGYGKERKCWKIMSRDTTWCWLWFC